MNKSPTKEIRDVSLELIHAFLKLAGETDPAAATARCSKNTAQCVEAFAPILEKFKGAPHAPLEVATTGTLVERPALVPSPVRACSTCRHRDVEVHNFPCRSCDAGGRPFPLWEPGLK